jgi:hypothetical protein
VKFGKMIFMEILERQNLLLETKNSLFINENFGK